MYAIANRPESDLIWEYFSKPRVYLQRGSSPRITAAIHVAADINHHSYSSFIFIFRIHLSYSSFVFIFRSHSSCPSFITSFASIFRIRIRLSHLSLVSHPSPSMFHLHLNIDAVFAAWGSKDKHMCPLSPTATHHCSQPLQYLHQVFTLHCSVGVVLELYALTACTLEPSNLLHPNAAFAAPAVRNDKTTVPCLPSLRLHTASTFIAPAYQSNALLG